MPEVRAFNSMEEVFAHIEQVKKHNDSKVEDWQRDTDVGDKFVYVAANIFIYGEILQNTKEEFDESVDDLVEKQVPYTKTDTYRFTRCSSVIVPEGELGTVHISHFIVKLDQKEFELAKAYGWPPTPAEWKRAKTRASS